MNWPLGKRSAMGKGSKAHTHPASSRAIFATANRTVWRRSHARRIIAIAIARPESFRTVAGRYCENKRIRKSNSFANRVKCHPPTGNNKLGLRACVAIIIIITFFVNLRRCPKPPHGHTRYIVMYSTAANRYRSRAFPLAITESNTCAFRTVLA
jgi:hypothetical protein